MSAQQNNLRSGAVNVPFLVCANRELGDMAAERAVAKLEHYVHPSGAPFLPLMQLKIINIIDEIGLPHPAGMEFALAAEKILF